jgi:4-carboxymuconolactone decarboxylase
MSRIPRLTPDELDDEQRAVYESIAGGARAQKSAFRLTDDQGALEGPFNAMLLHPAVGDALQQIGAALRFRGTLSPRAREIAILTVAAHERSRFEQYAHERVARQAGLTDAEIETLAAGGIPELTDADEAIVAVTTRHLLVDETLTEEQYADAAAVLGPARLFELTTVVGYYRLLALQMRVFGVR